MLKRIQEMVEELRSSQKPTDAIPPEAQADPIGSQTEWIPLKSGGTNFQTHRLVTESPQRVGFKASWGALLFYGAFFIPGIGIFLGFAIHNTLEQSWSLDADTIIPMLLGFIFMSVGGGLLYWGVQPIVFDKRSGYFWKGRTKPTEVFNISELKCVAKLSDIHALQLIREYVRGQKGSGYYSYELNLILKDGARLNVVDHGNRKKILADAGQLAQFLGKPLWNAIP